MRTESGSGTSAASRREDPSHRAASWTLEAPTPPRGAARRFGGLSSVADRWIVVGAVAAAVGALWAPSLPLGGRWWWGVVLGALGIASRARVLLPAGVLVLAAAAMDGQIAQLHAATGGEFDGEVLLVGDPRWRSGAVVVPFSATIDGAQHRWEGSARGPAAWRLEDASMGERWQLSVTAAPAEPDDRPFLWPRHLAGTAQIRSAHRLDGGSAPFRFANSLRGLVEASAASLSPRDAALLAGFVYGDDRGQLPEVVYDFRATSLTHLLAVSGSNVAFVLLLFAPLLARLSLPVRFGAVAVLLVQFAVLTRGEPSVLRACVLATLAVGAHALGRRASAPRLLSLAIIVLLLADPLLVRSVGFQLSVAATAAIVVGASPVSRLLRGPPWLRLALAATLCAQAGVLPVQIAVFGSLPLVSIPANVLAGPVAGPAMVWGLIGGLLGGATGGAVSSVLHLPTKLMLGWVAGVAQWGAALGWPQIEANEVIAAATVVACCAVAVCLLRHVGAASAGLAVAAAGIGLWIVAATHRPPFPTGPHVAVPSTEPVVVVVDRPDPARALSRLAVAGIDRIDVLVVRSASRAGREAVRVLDARHDIGQVLAPAGLGGGVLYRTVTEPVAVGGVTVTPTAERLRVSPELASDE